MSRAFSHAAGDFITFSPGATTAFNGGGQTAVFLWKPDTTVAHGLFVARNAGASTVYGMNPYLDNLVYYTASGFASTYTYTAGTWYLVAFTKATGSAAVRAHVYDYTATTWTHTNYAAVGDSAAGPVADMRLGWFSGTDILNGKMAAAALYNTVLSDLQIQTMNATLGAWLVLSPRWCVALNQASTATPVSDLTGNGGNQTAISGTTVSADEPAGWAYTSEVDLAVSFAASGTMSTALFNETHLSAAFTAVNTAVTGLSNDTFLSTALSVAANLTVTIGLTQTLIVTVGRLYKKWEVGKLGATTISSQSLEYIRTGSVSAQVGGSVINPVTDTVKMAFLSSPTSAPTAGDWKTASWNIAGPNQYQVQCLVGPGGATQLTAGAWYVWVQIFDNPETVVRWVDVLQVTA